MISPVSTNDTQFCRVHGWCNYAIALMNSNLALNGNTIRFGASGRNKTNDLVDGFKTANMSTTYSSHDCIMNSALDFLVYLFVPGKLLRSYSDSLHYDANLSA
ncbi:unnamed protein product [Fusarium graminearum]|uniref:Chromosome 2, complete genome n=1 Tax=Gibberella zeae (strain ATCC MYA-4620 / CBS 123657 / FGSC 9075 / NRRL 31084 / PH-1) TaxID=229533 RepID=I1S8Z4_GIBZE|nr:hypothetical protein FGSG_13323 [Fusarium graminearum PH-1]ESU14653.1 hypothetical protein FGSG_13323 [Fusarium graminearum PH-1]CEF77058.1 unnamed protein product [Fusarium graminearum]CZS80349.1 unnamed protein product [Fusarium graminearum]|eukprot:XP_011320078.1 hypothetical protein FGSG_13323 [Fusarium graminearum PH-1]